MPLFFVTVRTNFQYIVVAVFIVEREAEEYIEEALNLIKEQNPDVEPTAVMLDYCMAEINAVETVFPGNYHSMCYICITGRTIVCVLSCVICVSQHVF